MVLTQLLLLSFILIIFIILTLLALNIDHLGRFLSGKELREFSGISSHKNTIKDISRWINQHTQSESYSELVTKICPVEAITQVTVPEMFLVISENRCLGYACLECLRLILLRKLQNENS